MQSTKSIPITLLVLIVAGSDGIFYLKDIQPLTAGTVLVFSAKDVPAT
jgi:hypothetical protein